MPEPERHPVRPPILPKFNGELAKAEVHQMTLEGANVPPEVYLLGRVEALNEKVSNLEKGQDRIEATLLRMETEIRTIKEAHGAMGWKVVGALASAIGALLAAGYHLVLHQLKGQ